MNFMVESSKLLELRSKTDRQLAAYIGLRLETGLYRARVEGEPASREAAEKAYEEVRSLLPWLRNAPRVECRRLESKLEQLRELLEESSLHADLRVHTACS